MKKRILSLILIAVMAVCMLSACGEEEQQVETMEVPLVVGYTSFNEVFSPFFARTTADKDVVAMTQVNLLTLDRQGSVVYDGIEGETIAYNGTDYTYYGIADIEVNVRRDQTVAYDITLREDVKFSDGEVLNADDLIFTMYVLCDPTYDGPYKLAMAPIQGLEEYQSSMITLFDALIYAGKDNTNYTFWDEATQDAFWKELETAGTQFAQDVVDYLEESSGTASVAQAAKLWGYDGLAENASATEFFYVMCEAYAWDLEAMNNVESVGKTLFSYMENYDSYTKGIQFNQEVANISGIEKTGEYSVRVVMTEQNVANVHYFNIPVAPMHYYGDVSLYDYKNNQFGFVKGDLSSVHAYDTVPMGAGAYQFIPSESEEDEDVIVVNYTAYDDYYLGKPKTEQVTFVEISSAKKINGVAKGTMDLTDVSITKKVVNSIAEANQSVVDEILAAAEVNGETVDPETIVDVVSTISYDYSGYGYIGLNADIMNVDGDADSKESKYLRKAFATLFGVYREEFIDLYYGGNASVVEYPVSNASWAAPDVNSKDYEVAYAVGVDGKAIYNDEMSKEEKYAAAKEAVLEYFEAAGYTVENGVVTQAPEGAAMEFEIMIAANSLGEHPAYMILVHTKAALAELGINMTITDVTDENVMWNALEEGTCGMWVAAWGTPAEPDIYEVYHTEGAYSYMYGIADEKLSENLEKVRTTLNQSQREVLYKKCYDAVLDWAVEVPLYQKQKGIIYSQSRINAETLTPDMTEYYGWMKEVHNIEMYDIVIETE